MHPEHWQCELLSKPERQNLPLRTSICSHDSLSTGWTQRDLSLVILPIVICHLVVLLNTLDSPPRSIPGMTARKNEEICY